MDTATLLQGSLLNGRYSAEPGELLPALLAPAGREAHWF